MLIFFGVIAQLVAHLNGIEGVSGSNPLSSIRLHYFKLYCCVTLPITLPRRQAYASNRKWQSYGSNFWVIFKLHNSSSRFASLRANLTFLCRKYPGLETSSETADSVGYLP